LRIHEYHSKVDLLQQMARGRQVLHLGAVGETCANTEDRVARARESVHADLTAVAAGCVGVDYDQASVDALTSRGVFNNLLCADVRALKRNQINLPRIDIIVAGDVLEHLSEPGMMLDAAHRLADTNTRLAVTVPNALGLPIFVRNTLGKVVDGEDHVCSFNVHTLTNLLTRHGWTPAAAYTCHQKHAELSWAFRLGRALFRRVPRWGGTLMVVSRRV
jgi:hypothetical protein